MMKARFCSCPSDLGQEATGVPAIDRVVQSPLGKVLMIGGLAATAAKSFPGQFFAPFIASSIGALMLGVVADVDVTGMAPKAAPSIPPVPPGAQPRVG
jgi:hypothetical protein